MVLISTLPPISQLPSIRTIQSQSISTLTDAVRYLRRLYNPEIRGTHRLRRLSRTPTGTKAAVLQDQDKTRAGGPFDLVQSDFVGPATNNELAALRTDEFERAYSLRWLTALIAYLTTVQENDEAERDTVNGPSKCSSLIEDAASLLAVCSGPAGAGLLTRELCIPISSNHDSLMRRRVKGNDEGDGENSKNEVRNRSGGGGDNPDPITIRLRDIPLDNSDYGSLGAQTWGGAYVLSELIAEDPIKFGFGGCWCRRESAIRDGRSSLQQSSKEVQPSSRCSNASALSEFQILELGAGTGLVSIAIGKLLERFCSMGFTNEEVQEMGIPDGFRIVATDFYPAVLENLGSNIQMNFPSQDSSPVKVIHHPLDWSTFSSQIAGGEPGGLLDHPFDLVFGADIIYEAQHAIWIKKCLETLLQKPGHAVGREQGELLNDRSEHSDPPNKVTCTSLATASHRGNPTFHLVIPLRRTHQAESLSVEGVFPFGRFYSSQSAPLAGANHHGLLGTLSTQAASLTSSHLEPSLHSTSDSSFESRGTLGYSRDAQSEPELVILEKNTLVCDAEEGSNGHRPVEEVEYAHYTIGWGVRC